MKCIKSSLRFLVLANRIWLELACLEREFGFPRWSRGSCSVLHMPSSRVCSLWSLTLVHDRSFSHSSSRREDDAKEDRQQEHSFAYRVEVISWVCELFGLLPEPTKCKM